MPGEQHRLTGLDGREFFSDGPGTLGGNHRAGIHGRRDCPAARLFFADETTAIACMPEQYRRWRATGTA